jgi:hypothetical protein
MASTLMAFMRTLSKVEMPKLARIRYFGASEARVARIEVGSLLANLREKQCRWN